MIDKFLDKLSFTIEGTRVDSNICIWCGRAVPLTKSHIFPECLGIRFIMYVSCSACNSFFGEKVEGTIMNNAFFCAAISKLGLKDKKDAYRQAKKIDTETGYEVMINEDGRVQTIPKMLSNSRFIGTPKQLKEMAVKRFKRQNPNTSTRPIEEFYDDKESKNFQYEGVNFSKVIYPESNTEVRFSQKRDPEPKLVFKIVHEFLTTSGLIRTPEIRQNMKNLYSVAFYNDKTRIFFSSELTERYITNTTHTFREYKQLEEIPFLNFHYVMLRLSKKQILYVEVVFFGQVKTIFSIGPVTKVDPYTLLMLDIGLVFMLGEPMPFESRFPNVKRASETKLSDVVVEIRHWEIQERNKKITNQPQ